jgi:hypothetical protein
VREQRKAALNEGEGDGGKIDVQNRNTLPHWLMMPFYSSPFPPLCFLKRQRSKKGKEGEREEKEIGPRLISGGGCRVAPALFHSSRYNSDGAAFVVDSALIINNRTSACRISKRPCSSSPGTQPHCTNIHMPRS